MSENLGGLPDDVMSEIVRDLSYGDIMSLLSLRKVKPISVEPIIKEKITERRGRIHDFEEIGLPKGIAMGLTDARISLARFQLLLKIFNDSHQALNHYYSPLSDNDLDIIVKLREKYIIYPEQMSKLIEGKVDLKQIRDMLLYNSRVLDFQAAYRMVNAGYSYQDIRVIAGNFRKLRTGWSTLDALTGLEEVANTYKIPNYPEEYRPSSRKYIYARGAGKSWITSEEALFSRAPLALIEAIHRVTFN